MLLMIGNLFDKLFGKTANAVASSAEAKVKRETVGKAEAAMLGKQQEMQQKALRGVNKGLDPSQLKNRGGGGDEAAAAGPGGAYAPPPANMAYAPAPGQMPPPQMAQPQAGGAGMQPTCPNGHPMDPSWEVCPYCRSAANQGVRAAQIQPVGAAGAAKTVAIDASQLTHSQHTNKAVVGWVVCMAGQQKGQDFRLHDGRNVVGTAADCDIVIFDPYLSARHAILLVESKESHYVLQDLDSRNGTYVNRQRITKQELIDNDEIRFGQATFRFKGLY